MQDLPYQVKILAPKQQHLNFHVSDNVHDLRTLPKNVEILQDDGTYSSWLKVMAGCKILVIPINARSMYAEGVGTFLAAMALRTCVVISDTDAAKGIIDSGQAVLVPQGDAESLKHAITRVWENDEFRNQVAEKGHEHAIGAGDEKVLARRFFQETINFLGHP